MPPRYFVSTYAPLFQITGKSGTPYVFYGPVGASPAPTVVNNDDDADWFRNMGTPEIGAASYPFTETDAAGSPLPAPTFLYRDSIINTKRFPTDRGVPPAPEWRILTEDYGDPTLYFHFVRKKRWKSGG